MSTVLLRVNQFNFYQSVSFKLLMNHDCLELPDYCINFIHDVEIKTGAPLRIVEYESFDQGTNLTLANKSHPFHLLEYETPLREHKAHFVVSSSYMLLRLWDLPEEDRKIAKPVNARDLITRQMNQQKDDSESFRVDSRLCGKDSNLYQTLTSQLIHFSADCRIENEITETLPAHKNRQVICLIEKVASSWNSLFELSLTDLPTPIFENASALHLAYTDYLQDVGKLHSPFSMNAFSSARLANQLLDQIHTIKEPGARGDKLLTDAWAETLGLESLYEWRSINTK